MERCSKCGSTIAENRKFCTECGESIVGTNSKQQKYQKPWYNRAWGIVLIIVLGVPVSFIGFYAVHIDGEIVRVVEDMIFGVGYGIGNLIGNIFKILLP